MANPFKKQTIQTIFLELFSCLTLLPLYQVLSGELGMKNSQDTERVVGIGNNMTSSAI